MSVFLGDRRQEWWSVTWDTHTLFSTFLLEVESSPGWCLQSTQATAPPVLRWALLESSASGHKSEESDLGGVKLLPPGREGSRLISWTPCGREGEEVMYEVLSSLGGSAASYKDPTHGGESIHKGRGVLKGRWWWLHFWGRDRTVSFCGSCSLRDSQVGLTSSGRLPAQVCPAR